MKLSEDLSFIRLFSIVLENLGVVPSVLLSF